MPQPELPEVKILHAFEVIAPESNRFDYNNMAGQIALQEPLVGERWEKIEAATEGSIEHEDQARKLAIFYLIKTGEKLSVANVPESADTWASRFTQASIELYGSPDEESVIHLAQKNLKSFRAMETNPKVDQGLLEKVIAVYESILPVGLKDVTVENQNIQLEILGRQFLLATCGELFELIDPEKTYTPVEIYIVFGRAIMILARSDEGWNDWLLELGTQANLKVVADEHKIIIGKNRKNEQGHKLQGLLAHELVHAMRRVQADKHNDIILQRGLPNYLDTEEGLGVFTDFLLTEEVPENMENRYIDIALALGSDQREPIPRSDLFEFVRARNIISDQNKGKVIAMDQINKKSWQHVYRIFRGGSGADRTMLPAVFTKDIAYYKGFAEIQGFFESELAKGKTIEQIYTYLLAGKFDPTNPAHQNHVSQLGITL